MKLLDLDPSKDYILIGFPKCGQNSALKLLHLHNYKILKLDRIYDPEFLEYLKKWHPNKIPIIIKRDPVKMIWSSYWFFKYNLQMSLEGYLNYHNFTPKRLLGEENPLDHADFEKHIANYAELNPIVFDFEKISKEPGFPHLMKNKNKPDILPGEIELIKKYLKNYFN